MRILVVTAGDMHLGYLGCYGNDWIATPALDRLAAESVVFDQCIAGVPDVEAARRAWRSGCYQFPDHVPLADSIVGQVSNLSGQVTNLTYGGRADAHLAERLGARGIQTYLVSSSSNGADFSSGWGCVANVKRGDDKRVSLKRTLIACVKALDDLANVRDWLLWVDLGSLAPPWRTPAKWQAPYFPAEAEAGEPLAPLIVPPDVLDATDDRTILRLQGSYAGVVTGFDRALGRLVRELADRRLLDELTLVFTADRGFPLGEHGIVGPCRPWLHDELIHVPLIIRLPGRAQAGRRVSALVQSVDLMPTLLDLAGAPSPLTPLPEGEGKEGGASNFHGHSLLPLCRGEKAETRPYACSALRVGDAVEWAIRGREWAYILPLQDAGAAPRPPQFYMKPEDRWEVNNVIQHHWEWVEGIDKTLREFAARAREPEPLTPPALPQERSTS